MSERENIQLSFLESIKDKLPASRSLADELAEILHISRDSAYRRIRGETVLSLDEVKILSNRFNVSVDELLSPASEMVAFQCHAIDHVNFTFEGWLKSILGNLEMLNRHAQKELICSAKEIPVFYYFHFPQLAAFKIFFWMKTMLKFPQFQLQKFSPEIIPGELLAQGRKIWGVYASLSSTEIWNQDAFYMTLRQIEFYRRRHFFSKPDQILLLYDQFAELLSYVRSSAASGKRGDGTGHFKLYRSDALMADNTVLFKMGDKRTTFISHNNLNIQSTTHKRFCRQTEDFLGDLQDNAVLMSDSGERERNKFFDHIQEVIEREKEAVEMNSMKLVKR
jgi:hypothetical protein